MTLVEYGFLAVMVLLLVNFLVEALVNWERTVGWLILIVATIWGAVSYLSHHHFQFFFSILLGIFGFVIALIYTSDR
jgi:4-hydroxybenzoate polyprenyltransferase